MRRVKLKPKILRNRCGFHSYAFDSEIQQSVRAICAKYPNSYWSDLDKTRKYPTEFVTELSNAGYLALLIPSEYGGSSLGIKTACGVLEEIHKSGCNGGAAHAQMYTMATLLKHGSEDQKVNYLPKIATGKLRMQAFGVSEPNAGTNTLNLYTTAKLDFDKWIVNGTKLWTSRAEHSDLMLLLAKTSERETEKSVNHLSTFIVDMNAAVKNGMTISPIETMINHSTCEVHFENVPLAEDCIIGQEGKGFNYILDSLNAERILIASECIGDGKYFLERMTEYAKDRTVFTAAIGSHQGIQFPIAECYAQLQAAELMVEKAAATFDYLHGPVNSKRDKFEIGRLANLAKLLASEASWKCADTCMQVFGGFGFATEYGIERKWREARLYRTAPISTNLIYSYLGEKVLGLPRSY